MCLPEILQSSPVTRGFNRKRVSCPFAVHAGFTECPASSLPLPGEPAGKKFAMLCVFLSAFFFSFSQNETVSGSPGLSHIKDSLLQGKAMKNRRILITGINLAGYGGSLVILNETWYKDFPKSSFHTFNDSKEWLQVDKVGHAWTACNTGRLSAAMWRWAGLPSKKAALIGGLSSSAYLTVIEILDGHSSEWGWSWTDMAANIFGSGLFLSQELAWEEQRIQFKFSFHKKNYDEPLLQQRADDLFGNSRTERMLKDYNQQTYWLSANLKSFFPRNHLPAWLNVALGYGADGMFGGFENSWKDASGNNITRYDIPRKRQFYLSPDIDFTKIKTNSRFWRTAFSFLNAFKCPAPALMLDSGGKLKVHAVYF